MPPRLPLQVSSLWSVVFQSQQRERELSSQDADGRAFTRGAAGSRTGHNASGGQTRLCAHLASSLMATPGSARPSGAHLVRPPGTSTETSLSRPPNSYTAHHYNKISLILCKEMGSDRRIFSCTQSFAVSSGRRTLKNQETNGLSLAHEPRTFIRVYATRLQQDSGNKATQTGARPSLPRPPGLGASRPTPRPPGPSGSAPTCLCRGSRLTSCPHSRLENRHSRKRPCASPGGPGTPHGAPAPTPAAGRVT